MSTTIRPQYYIFGAPSPDPHWDTQAFCESWDTINGRQYHAILPTPYRHVDDALAALTAQHGPEVTVDVLDMAEDLAEVRALLRKIAAGELDAFDLPL